MTSELTPLILDFLEWLEPAPKPYADVMDVWRTSCPRLTVWEDATEQGLVERATADHGACIVKLSAEGSEFLRQHRRSSASVTDHALHQGNGV